MSIEALVVFDIDGTLLQTQTVTIPSIQRIFTVYGLPVPAGETISAFFGKPVAEYETWLGTLCPPGMMDAIIADTNRCELEVLAKEGRLYPGAKESVMTLVEAGCRLGFCSNGPQDYVETFLRAHGFDALRPVVRARGDRAVDKTRMLGEILAEVALRPVVVVGDRHDDVESAHAHGAYAVGARYGFGTPEEIEEADLLVESASEIAGAVFAVLERHAAST